MFGIHVFFWLSWVQPIMPIELPWGPNIHQLKQLGIPYYRMGTAITSSAKFLPCILKKIKCEYFLQSIPNHHPPPPPHERANGVTVGTLNFSSMDNSYS